MQIQSSIIPHLEVLHKEQMYAKIVLKKTSNLSTHEGLIDLVEELAIQHKSLDIALNNWDTTLKILLEVNSTFLAKHGITLQNPLTSESKRGENKQKGEIYYKESNKNLPNFEQILITFFHSINSFILRIKLNDCKQ